MGRVLVADDEPAVLEVLSEVVEDLGHEVLRAHDGREALALARSLPPQLVVTDHMMPRLSGLELCRELRRDDVLSAVPIILLSAALQHGTPEAQAFLPKPFELAEFERLVQQTLKAGGQAAPNETAPAPAPSAQTLESLDWMAHELKTPLAAAKLKAALLERQLVAAGGAPDLRHLASVQVQLDVMDGVVSSVLDASKLAEGCLALRPERQDLPAFLRGVVAQWRDDRPGFEFELVLPVDALEVRFDDLRVRQVLNNLLSNAVKYGSPPQKVQVALEVSPAVATVHVSDFGRGIPAGELRHLFSRFRRVSAEGVGHGLGLYIAAELARLHGGSLTAESTLGRGSRFSLTLPRR